MHLRYSCDRDGHRTARANALAPVSELFFQSEVAQQALLPGSQLVQTVEDEVMIAIKFAGTAVG